MGLIIFIILFLDMDNYMANITYLDNYMANITYLDNYMANQQMGFNMDIFTILKGLDDATIAI